jgi:hypothetical protein
MGCLGGEKGHRTEGALRCSNVQWLPTEIIRKIQDETIIQSYLYPFHVVSWQMEVPNLTLFTGPHERVRFLVHVI